MKIITVANQKGGVGKTTTVVGLGGILSQQGKRVLMVDLDPQGSLTSYFKFNPDEIEPTVYDLFQHGGKVPEALPARIVRHLSWERLDLLPASTSLAVLEKQVGQQGGMGLVLSKTLAILWNDYDYVLIDTPPVLGMLLINALAASQQILVPVQTEHLAIKGLERMMRTLKMVTQSLKRELPYTIVPTLFDRRTHASVDSLRILRKTWEDHVWSSAIAIDTRLRDASKAGVPPVFFSPDSRGVRSYFSLAKLLDGPQVQKVVNQ